MAADPPKVRKRFVQLEGGQSVIWPPCTPPPLLARAWYYEGDQRPTPLTAEQLAEVKAREKKPKPRKTETRKLFEEPPP